MRFALFLLLNFILFIRPEDLWPDIAGLRLYLLTITACLLVNAQQLKDILSAPSLRHRPVDVCFLCFWLAIGLSHFVRFRLDRAWDEFGEFGKVVAYYFLLRVTLDTPERFRAFLGWGVALAGGMIGLVLLNYEGVVEFETLEIIQMAFTDPATGETNLVDRVCGLGMFSDPNDLCLLIVFGAVCCCYRAATAPSWLGWGLWLLPLAVFGRVFVLTGSRGGMLALLAAIAGVAYIRLGWKRSAPLLLLCMPALVLSVGGRQSDIGGGDTSHERVMLWAAGLGVLFDSPFWIPTGIGANEYPEECFQVAHNSYVHAYVELGLFGGTMFFTMFYSVVRRLHALPAATDAAHPEWLTKARPFVFGLVVGFAMGMSSLSRNYILPTYMVLGLGVNYLELTRREQDPVELVDGDWVRRTAITGAIGLLLVKFGTQFLGVIGF